jgi:hypothetical protein
MKILCTAAAIALFISTMSLISCSREAIEINGDPTPTPLPEGVFNQGVLDSAVLVMHPSDLNITGNPFGTRFNATEINSIRDITTNKRADEALQVGHVFAIKSFRNNNGQRGTLINVHIMVKRENGYNPNGGDFEYINIDFDPNTDYTQHPNGELPDITDTVNRGIDVARFNCVQCHRHSSTAGDFLFTEK